MPCTYEVTILGVNSALPVKGRHPSCQVVNYNEHCLMIDCGEGSQSQLSKYKIKRSKISDIFISHMHGDHVFGLPGLLTSYSLLHRTYPLTVHGPIGIKTFLETIFRISESRFGFDLHIQEYDAAVSHDFLLHGLRVHMFPLQHRIPTLGFRFTEESPQSNIDKSAIEKYSLTTAEILAAKAQKNIERADQMIAWQDVVEQLPVRRSYAYVSDSIYDLSLVPHLHGVSTLYHETTYLDDMKYMAESRGHSTIGQAADIAKRANVGQLITGHYSSRYQDLEPFVEQGQKVWPHVVLGEEGKTYEV